MYHTGDLITSGVDAPSVAPAYQRLIDSNPYRNATYRVSPFQQLLSWLGFRSKADDWKENMAVQAQEYDASILQKAYNESYDSPASQVSRMKAAGLNPDIDGGSNISSGESSPMPEDPSTPMQADTPQMDVHSFASGLLNVFTTAIGMAGSIQGLQRNRLENSLLSGQSYEQGSGLAERLATLFVPRSDDSEVWDNIEVPWQNKAIKTAELFAGRLPKHERQGFSDYITHFFSGALGDVKSYDELQKRLDSMVGYSTKKSTYGEPDTELFKIFTDELGVLNREILKASKKADKEVAESASAEAQYNQEYYENMDAGVQAAAENAQAQFNETNLNMNEILNSSLERIIDKIDKRAQEGGLGGGLSNIALSLLSIFRLMVTTQGLPSVSRSSSSGSSSWSKGAGNAMHGSESMSIGW